jgi:hypothetical protein
MISRRTAGVVEKVRTERPHDYPKLVAAVMPKRMELEDVAPLRRAIDMTDDELAAIALSGPSLADEELAAIALGGDPTDAKQH